METDRRGSRIADELARAFRFSVAAVAIPTAAWGAFLLAWVPRIRSHPGPLLGASLAATIIVGTALFLVFGVREAVARSVGLSTVLRLVYRLPCSLAMFLLVHRLSYTMDGRDVAPTYGQYLGWVVLRRPLVAAIPLLYVAIFLACYVVSERAVRAVPRT